MALLTPFLRHWRTRWGATDDEVNRSWPGDDLVPHPKWQWTHAVTIRAPAPQVWPWVVQIGQGRGGFYSYELLENLVGCDIHNSERIVPDLQRLQVGDSIKLHPEMPGMPVAIVEPPQALVLHARGDPRGGEPVGAAGSVPGNVPNLIWSFLLYEPEPGVTRLIGRGRSAYGPGLGNALRSGPALLEPIWFVMERKMLLGIKERAERMARATESVPPRSP